MTIWIHHAHPVDLCGIDLSRKVDENAAARSFFMAESSNIPEPGQDNSVLYVGQDRAGHWLVQENHGRLEGRFISGQSAYRFARSEVHAFPGATLVVTREWIEPNIPFDPAPVARASSEQTM
jgi:hypothetical protein